MSNKGGNKDRWWTPIVHTAAHATVATAMAAIIALAAVLLGKFVDWLEVWGASDYTVAVLRFVEHAIITLDAFALLVFVVIMTVRSIKAALNKRH